MNVSRFVRLGLLALVAAGCTAQVPASPAGPRYQVQDACPPAPSEAPATPSPAPSGPEGGVPIE